MKNTLKIFISVTLMLTLSVLAAVLLSSCKVDTYYKYPNADMFIPGNCEIAGNVSDIDIGWVAGNVKIVYSNTDKISISETSESDISSDDYQVHHFVDGEKLIIRFVKSGKFNFTTGIKRSSLKKDLTLTIPEKLNLQKLTVETVSAAVDSPEIIKVSNARFDSVSGDIKMNFTECKALTASSVSGDFTIGSAGIESLKANTVSGDFHLKTGDLQTSEFNTVSGIMSISSSGKVGKITFDGVSGNFVLLGFCPDIFKGETVSGNMALRIFGEPSFKATANVKEEKFHCDFPITKKGKEYISGNGSSSLSFETMSGKISIEKAPDGTDNSK